jgi:uncharacterized protein DUF1579
MFRGLGPIWVILAWVLFRPSSALASDAALPPQMHLLAEQEGEWNVAFQVLDAEQHWQTSKCTAKIRMVLGGSAQAMDFEGTLNGMKYLGTGLTCFDREAGVWQSSWADNLGARITLYQGAWKGKDFILEGIDWAQGQQIHSRITSSNIGPKHFDWTMDISTDGRTYHTIARAKYEKR